MKNHLVSTSEKYHFSRPFPRSASSPHLTLIQIYLSYRYLMYWPSWNYLTLLKSTKSWLKNFFFQTIAAIFFNSEIDWDKNPLLYFIRESCCEFQSTSLNNSKH